MRKERRKTSRSAGQLGVGHLSKAQVSEIASSLRRNHTFPLKYCYVNSGAAFWDDVRNDPDYDLGRRELETLKRSLPQLAKFLPIGPVDVIHLGVGNGSEIPLVLDLLRTQAIANYRLVDISKSMLHFALVRAKLHSSNTPFQAMTTDISCAHFERCLTSSRPRDNSLPRIVVLVNNGGILSDPTLLDRIGRVLKKQDRMIISLELYSANREARILRSYEVASVKRLLQNSLARFSIRSKLTDYAAHYDPARQCVCISLSIRPQTRSGIIEAIGINQREIGGRIVVLDCWRPTRQSFLRRLRDSGLSPLCEEWVQATGCVAGVFGRRHGA